MTFRRQQEFANVWFPVLIGVVLALVALLVPSTQLGNRVPYVVQPPVQDPNGTILVGSTVYSFETQTVFGPHLSNFTYLGAKFQFEVWCSGSVGLPGARLCGNTSVAGGSVFPFSFWEPGGPPPMEPLAWVTWISPDGHQGVQFEPDSGGSVHLLVAT